MRTVLCYNRCTKHRNSRVQNPWHERLRRVVGGFKGQIKLQIRIIYQLFASLYQSIWFGDRTWSTARNEQQSSGKDYT